MLRTYVVNFEDNRRRSESMDLQHSPKTCLEIRVDLRGTCDFSKTALVYFIFWTWTLKTIDQSSM